MTSKDSVDKQTLPGENAPPANDTDPGAATADSSTRGSRRRLRGQANIWLGAFFIVAIALMLNYLSFRHFQRWDWTEAGIYTLSERTLAELEALTEPVEIYLFMGEGERSFPEMKELLERYRVSSPLLSVELVDPHTDPARYRQLARRFDIQTLVDEFGGAEADVAAVAVLGQERVTIDRTDLVSVDFGMADDEEGAKVDVRAEQALTGAIVRLTQGEPTKICVTEGHGEWALALGGERTLGPILERLRRDQIELETVETLGGEDIGERCDALFIIGPQTTFTEEEAVRIQTYLEGGGGVLLAVDPVMHGDHGIKPTGLDPLLELAGIRITEGVVWEENLMRLLAGGHPVGPFLVGAGDFGAHETTGPLVTSGAPIRFMEARGLVVAEDRSADPLIFTSEESWVEFDLERLIEEGIAELGENDLRGPVALAVGRGGTSCSARWSRRARGARPRRTHRRRGR